MKKKEEKKLYRGPDLDKYLCEVKRNFTSYMEGAKKYSMNYYSFVVLAKKAKANIRYGRRVVVDLDILDDYILRNCSEKGGAADEQKTND